MKKLFFALFALVVWAGCNQQPINDADLLCVDAGKNKFEPSTFRFANANVLAYSYEFGPGIAYDFTSDANPDNDGEQCDWNKLGGLSADIFSNHDNSLMIGFRYDLSGKLLIAPYYHEKGVAYWAEYPCNGITTAPQVQVDVDLPVLELAPTERFEVHWNRQNDSTVSVTVIANSGETLFFEKAFDIDRGPNFSRWREIGIWFGGSSPAPQDICCIRTAIAFE